MYPPKPPPWAAAWHLFPLPVDLLGVGPEVFQGVIGPRILVEYMHHDIAVVLHDPPARLVALDAQTLLVLRTHEGIDLFGQRVNFASARSGHHDEEVEDHGNAA